MAILLDSGASALVHEGTVKRTPLHAAGKCVVGSGCVGVVGGRCECVVCGVWVVGGRCVCVVCGVWVVGGRCVCGCVGWWVVHVFLAVYNFIYLLCWCVM